VVTATEESHRTARTGKSGIRMAGRVRHRYRLPLCGARAFSDIRDARGDAKETTRKRRR
jgi:hypothetical protein